MKHEAPHPSHEDLFAYRDGELPHEKRTVLEAHVTGCGHCRSLIDEISSLEAELRRAPDDLSAEDWDRMPAAVRERIASAAREEASPRARAPGIERRRAGEPERPREEGRIGAAPRLPWVAVLATASAAAAVLVVVVILVHRRAFRGAVSPLPPPAAVSPSLPPAAESPARTAQPVADVTQREAQTAEPVPLGLIKSAQPAPAAPGGEYESVVRDLGLPPVWDDRVSPDALGRAEPRLRLLYQMGKAGTDSARVRLYLAEAARLRYAPGDSALCDRIVHHYRRAIRLAGSGSEVARVAEERLRTLER